MPLTYSPNRQDPGASLLRHAKAVMVMCYLDPGEAHRVEVVKRMEGIVAAKQIAEFEKQKKNGVPTVFPTRKSHQFFRIRKTGISLSRSTKRRRSDSNRCIKVLQTSPLPLGYGAIKHNGCNYNQTGVGKQERVPWQRATFLKCVGARAPTCTPAGEPV